MRGLMLTMAALSLCLTGCLFRASKQAQVQPRLFRCHRAVGPIVIDGKVDEPAWGNAEVVDDFRIPVTGARPKFPTKAMLLWDSENLYLAAFMVDNDITATRKEHDSQLWEDDVVELFLKPREDRNPYFEFEINPLGATLDLLFGRRGAGSFDRWRAWESGMKAAVAIRGTLNDWTDKDAGWCVEVAIPLKALAATGPKPALGDRWRFAVCRYDYSVYIQDGPELSSSALLPTSNYHQYEGYDYLEFAE